MTTVLDLRSRGNDAQELERFSIVRSRPAWERDGRIPIVYSEHYDFLLLEKLDRKTGFNPRLRSTAYNLIAQAQGLTRERIYTPSPVSDADLELVHTPEYLNALNQNSQLFPVIMGLPELAKFGPGLCEEIMRPIRYGAGGTLLAFEIAQLHGWALNLSGGFHHAKRDQAGGFCFVADTALAITRYLRGNPDGRVLCVDLDAHHGDGVASYFLEHPRVAILDMYNREMYPYRRKGTVGLQYDLPVDSSTTSDEYLKLLGDTLPRALEEQQPTLILFNAGNDIYCRDRYGRMRISAAAILERDSFVYSQAFRHGAALVQVLSGGYAPDTPKIIADSVGNLRVTVFE